MRNAGRLKLVVLSPANRRGPEHPFSAGFVSAVCSHRSLCRGRYGLDRNHQRKRRHS